jgi:hypothetical protein
MTALLDLTGQKFHMWTVIELIEEQHNGHRYWKCKCDCGTIKNVQVSQLTTGRSKCCKKHGKGMKPRHGRCKTKVYRSWTHMRNRCNNTKNERYESYGGRGIKVCERWDIFENFLADMGEPPGKNYSIERTDNNGDYTPENCQWASAKEQANNRSNRRTFEYKGEHKTLNELAEINGLAPSTVESRISQRGWSIDKAVETPARKLTKKTKTE